MSVGEQSPQLWRLALRCCMQDPGSLTARARTHGLHLHLGSGCAHARTHPPCATLPAYASCATIPPCLSPALPLLLVPPSTCSPLPLLATLPYPAGAPTCAHRRLGPQQLDHLAHSHARGEAVWVHDQVRHDATLREGHVGLQRRSKLPFLVMSSKQNSKPAFLAPSKANSQMGRARRASLPRRAGGGVLIRQGNCTHGVPRVPRHSNPP